MHSNSHYHATPNLFISWYHFFSIPFLDLFCNLSIIFIIYLLLISFIFLFYFYLFSFIISYLFCQSIIFLNFYYFCLWLMAKHLGITWFVVVCSQRLNTYLNYLSCCWIFCLVYALSTSTTMLHPKKLFLHFLFHFSFL